MSLDNAYMQVGSPSNVQNINPYSGAFWEEALSGGNAYNSALSQLSRLSGQMSSLFQQAQGIETSPTAGWNAFMSQVPALQQLAESAVTPYGAAAGNYADVAAQQARRAVEAAYAQSGNIYTGGFGSAVTEAMAAPYFQAAANTEQLQANVLNSLFNAGRTAAEQGVSTALSGQLQALGLGADILGTQYGTVANQANTYLSAMASMAQPEWWQPTYASNPNYWSNWVPELLGGALGFALGGGSLGFGAAPANSSLLGDWSNWTFG